MSVLIDVTVPLTLADQARDRHPVIPFRLNGSESSIEVRLSVEDGADAGIDLGLVGPGGLRGWSGGARMHYVVTAVDATPGYEPGLGEGEWGVLLGLHRLPRTGVTLRVQVESPAHRSVDHGPQEPPVERALRGSERNLPAVPGLHWFAGDPHNHSLHSDGELSLWELANEGVRSGLDFLGCTDHNTTTHHRFLTDVGRRHGILLLPGQEMTTHRGHANAWGRIGTIDFRREAQWWVDEVERRGGLMSINHPVSDDCSWLHPLTRRPPGAELYHGSWFDSPTDTSILAWHLGWDQDVIVLAGGDFHRRNTPHRPGLPTLWVAAEECSEEAILDGMRAGRTTVTASATLIAEGEARPVLFGVPTLLRLDRGRGEQRTRELIVLEAEGCVLVDRNGGRTFINGGEERLDAPVEAGPYRLEDADRHVLAMSA